MTGDEWTTDTDENRRLRAAAHRLLVVDGLPELTRRRLLRMDRQLADVRLLPAGVVIPDWGPTRINTRLNRLLALADLIPAQESVEHQVGDVQVRGFVLSPADHGLDHRERKKSTPRPEARGKCATIGASRRHVFRVPRPALSRQGQVCVMRVFISYSREDQAAVEALNADLVRARFQVWMDDELSGGKSW